jgi:hypothetical protein
MFRFWVSQKRIVRTKYDIYVLRTESFPRFLVGLVILDL